jgi:hypothetical protein
MPFQRSAWLALGVIASPTAQHLVAEVQRTIFSELKLPGEAPSGPVGVNVDQASPVQCSAWSRTAPPPLVRP